MSPELLTASIPLPSVLPQYLSIHKSCSWVSLCNPNTVSSACLCCPKYVNTFVVQWHKGTERWQGDLFALHGKGSAMVSQRTLSCLVVELKGSMRKLKVCSRKNPKVPQRTMLPPRAIGFIREPRGFPHSDSWGFWGEPFVCSGKNPSFSQCGWLGETEGGRKSC